MAKLLLQAGARINQACGDGDFNTPLTLAIRHGPPNLIRTLINHGARIRVGKYTLESGVTQIIDPVMTAVKSGNLQAVEILLEKKPWFKLTRNNALLAVVKAGGPGLRILEVLLESFNPEMSDTVAQMGQGALNRARSAMKEEMVETLIDYGC